MGDMKKENTLEVEKKFIYILTEVDSGKNLPFEVIGRRAHIARKQNPDMKFIPLSDIIEFLYDEGFAYEVDWEEEVAKIRPKQTRRVRFDLAIFEPEDLEDE